MNMKFLVLGVLLAAMPGMAGAEEVVSKEPTKSAPAASSPTPAASPSAANALADIPAEQWLALAKLRVDEASKRLGLSDAQKEKLQPIIEEQIGKARALAEKYRGASRLELLGAMQEIRSLREEAEARITPLLTPAQQAEAEKMREERQAKTRERMRAWRSGDEEGLKKMLFPELQEDAAKKS